MRNHDLVILGAGSGNFVVDDSFADLDVAIVEPGAFGGTCLNRGCIPTKMLAYTAEVAQQAREAERFGVRVGPVAPDWASVRDRIFARLDPIAEGGERGRAETSWITVYRGEARFTGPRTVEVDGAEIRGEQVVIAAGGRPMVPPPVADSGLPYETSDTIMRIDHPPRRLAVLGGGYIAAELAEVFAAFGSEIVLVEQAETLLGPQDDLVSREFTELTARRWDLRLGRSLTGLGGRPGELRLILDDGSEVAADMLLVATGRQSNADRLDLAKAGVDTHEDGRIAVDAHQRTSAEGVWALGDICSPAPLKHVANREAEVVAHNLRHPDRLISARHDLVPAAVFTVPQVASVGATEQSLRADGRRYRVGLSRYADTAYGWAMEDRTGFCKVLAEVGEDGAVGRLLGAHLMGPQASSLIAPLILAMSLDLDAATVRERPYWIHPALSEVVEQALVGLAGG